MQPSASAETFKAFLSSRGVDPEAPTLQQLVAAILDFYETVPAEGLADDPEADMLLFQYGVYDWGQGEYFEFDITRQFVVESDGDEEDEDEDDEAISQLHCTVRYTPTPELVALGDADHWCETQEEILGFRGLVFSSDAYLKASAAAPVGVEIVWEEV